MEKSLKEDEESISFPSLGNPSPKLQPAIVRLSQRVWQQILATLRGRQRRTSWRTSKDIRPMLKQGVIVGPSKTSSTSLTRLLADRNEPTFSECHSKAALCCIPTPCSVPSFCRLIGGDWYSSQHISQYGNTDRQHDATHSGWQDGTRDRSRSRTGASVRRAVGIPGLRGRSPRDAGAGTGRIR